jgi:hypothetical protein
VDEERAGERNPVKVRVGWPRWGPLVAVALLGGLSGLYVAITPAGGQTPLTDGSWDAFAAREAEVAAIVSRLLVVLGLLGLGFGLASAAIAALPYRAGQAWSWTALWLLPLIYGGIAARQLVDGYPVGYFYAALAVVAGLSLLLSVPARGGRS